MDRVESREQCERGVDMEPRSAAEPARRAAERDDSPKAGADRGRTDGGGGRSLLQRCANIQTFTALASASLLMHTVAFAIQTSTITSVQKAYGLTTFDTGVWLGVYVVGEVISGVLVSYFAGQSHKPRVVAIGMMVTAATCIAHAVPHFIYPYVAEDEAANSKNYYDGVCVIGGLTSPSFNATESAAHGSTSEPCEPNSSAGYNRDVVLAVYIAATVVLGLGYGPVPVLPVIYMDDNAGTKGKASFYQSIFYGVYYLGPLVGYSLAAGTLSIFVDLTEVEFTEEDTYWVGAWWLGYVVSGIGIFLLAIPMFFFPASLPSSDGSKEDAEDAAAAAVKDKALQLAIAEQEAEDQVSAKDMSSSSVSEDDYKEGLPSAKLLLPTLWSFMKNPVYVLTTLTMCMNAWVEAGYFSYLPKYLEVQFHQSASVADIQTGVCGSVASAVGVLAGGWVVSRFKLKAKNCAVVLFTTYFIGSLMYFSAMFFYCDQFVADRDDIHMTGYSCEYSEYYPVCINGTKSYYSPCHAGCRNDTVDENKLVKLLGCLCRDDVVGDAGVCTGDCSSVIPYLIMIVVAYGFPSFAYMAGITILLRCVKKEHRSFSLGIHAECLSLVGWIPAPMLYGAVIDNTCLTWETVGAARQSCTAEEEGSCLQYDNDRFRIGMHALTFGAMIFGFLLAAANCLIAYFGAKPTDLSAADAVGLEQDGLSITYGKSDTPDDIRIYDRQPS